MLALLIRILTALQAPQPNSQQSWASTPVQTNGTSGGTTNGGNTNGRHNPYPAPSFDDHSDRSVHSTPSLGDIQRRVDGIIANPGFSSSGSDLGPRPLLAGGVSPRSSILSLSSNTESDNGSAASSGPPAQNGGPHATGPSNSSVWDSSNDGSRSSSSLGGFNNSGASSPAGGTAN